MSVIVAAAGAGAALSWAPSWLLWLAVPVGATSLAALWSGWRSWRARRRRRPLPTEAAVRAHGAYLDALVLPARARDRRVAPGMTQPGPDGAAGAGTAPDARAGASGGGAPQPGAATPGGQRAGAG